MPPVDGRRVPAALVAARFVIAAWLVWDAWDGQAGPTFVPLFIAAVFFDIVDGMIARRLGVATPQLRLWDGYADVTLYGVVLVCAWRAFPALVPTYGPPVVGLAAYQVFSWFVSWVKFRRITSYHSYVAKAWGLTLAFAVVGVFGWHQPAWIRWALAAGAVSVTEDVLITLILPAWHHDVWSIVHALRLRGKIAGGRHAAG